MSATPDTTPSARYGWIRPRWFLAGLGIGTAALGFLGWRASRIDMHPDFIRFHSMISPERGYYPTVNEMAAIARSRCRPDQILVIVGGNSVLLGVWQRDVDVWTGHLQEALGDRYCVLNFAFRGGYPTEGGAVVAEVLRKEFPRQILIANAGPLVSLDAVGHVPYRYLFWQAYFAGKLEDFPARKAKVRAIQIGGGDDPRDFEESRISSLLDAGLRYHDLWNRFTLLYAGDSPNIEEPYFPLFLKPHGEFADKEVDGTDPLYDEQHYPEAGIAQELRIITGIAPFYSRSADGHWILAAATVKDRLRNNDAAIPPDLRARTLLLVSASSPFYVSRLGSDDKAMVVQASDDSISLYRRSGYEAMDYGWDFVAEDFGDRTHLTKLGGAKLAALVAPKIQQMAAKLGYTP